MSPRLIAVALLATAAAAHAQLAVRGETVYTMAGAPVRDGVVLIEGAKIRQVGPASAVQIPAGWRTLRAKVVTPGLVDAHTVVGLAGYLNQPHDQDQVERNAAMQPELRAIDAYNPRETLVEYVRSYGVTTIHTGHGPGQLISGQTMVVKTAGRTVEEALLRPAAMVAATLGEGARATQGRSPGTRSKMIALLRAELIKAREYADKAAKAQKGSEPARDLHLETLSQVLKGDLPLLVTVHRSHDILTTLRLGKEFGLKVVLDGAAEAHDVLPQIRESGYPVIVHPTMARANGDTENLSLETAAKLEAARIPFAMQSGFESYVPKTRVVLFEAAVAAANGLGFEAALGSVTIAAARLLGVADRVGSLERGKDGDLALYDGDPFEYATHCTGVVLNGQVVSEVAR